MNEVCYDCVIVYHAFFSCNKELKKKALSFSFISHALFCFTHTYCVQHCELLVSLEKDHPDTYWSLQISLNAYLTCATDEEGVIVCYMIWLLKILSAFIFFGSKWKESKKKYSLEGKKKCVTRFLKLWTPWCTCMYNVIKICWSKIHISDVKSWSKIN